MRHRVADKKFNRTSNERKALFSGLLRNLTEHGEIVTTLAKAKAVKRLADRMVSQAKTNTVASRRVLHKKFGKRDMVSTLVETVAPAMADRTSGYVSVIAIGPRRGDNTPMAKLAFVHKAGNTSLKKLQPKAVNSTEVKKEAIVAQDVEIKKEPAVKKEATEKKAPAKKVVAPAKKATKKAAA